MLKWWSERNDLTKKFTVSMFQFKIYGLMTSAMTFASQRIVILSCNSLCTKSESCQRLKRSAYGWSNIRRLSGCIPRTSRLLDSSAFLNTPRPSAFPVERHKWNKPREYFVDKDKIVGAKNMASSSGWAVTSRIFWDWIANSVVLKSSFELKRIIDRSRM